MTTENQLNEKIAKKIYDSRASIPNKDKELEDEIKKKRKYFNMRFKEDEWASDLEKCGVDIAILEAELKGRKDKEKELIEEFEKMTYKLQSDMNVLDEQEIHLDIDKWEDFKQQLQELKEKSKWKLNLI